MTLSRLLALLSAILFAMPAKGQSFLTPESALAEHQAAYKARDIDRFLASIDFIQEAKEALAASANGNEIPSDPEVSVLAEKRKMGLRQHLGKFQFKAATFDDCEVVTTTHRTETLVRLVLRCNDPHGSTFFPVRVMLQAGQWRVVRGG